MFKRWRTSRVRPAHMVIAFSSRSEDKNKNHTNTDSSNEFPLPKVESPKRTVASRYPTIRVSFQEPSSTFASTSGVEGEGAESATTKHVTPDSAQTPTRTSMFAEEKNDVTAFLDEKDRQVLQERLDRNAAIPYPTHPDDMVPEFRRVRHSEKILVIATDPDYPTFQRKDQFVPLPPPPMHPWVKNTPIGPHIVHGDGQLGVAGTGEVGFDDSDTKLPRGWRGLQHRSILHQKLPERNGRVTQDAVVRHSFTLTGRGLFATREIAAGETIMIVHSTAQRVGVMGEIERLVDMCCDLLMAARDGEEAAREFLHAWVFTGQPSSLLEHWPAYATHSVIERIGGLHILHALELHEAHVARLAAVMDLNSFLVESYYAERKGMAYFPEAGFLNHSCIPNATYDVMPEHTFHESDYYIDEIHEAARSVNKKGMEKGQTSDVPRPNADSETSRSVGSLSTIGIQTESAVEQIHPSAHERDQIHASVEASHATGSAVMGYPNLTASCAPRYLFCCRATKNIPEGAEILISYVPPEWSFDNRQYVLHDRYRFWCKCPKCAPMLDAKYARVPRVVIGMLIFSMMLQLLVLYQRNVEEAVVREENELRESQRKNGEEPTRPHRPRGFFEMAEEKRLHDLYEPDRLPLPAQLANDPWARPPR